ncbi:peptidase C45, acyl-coenzyme A - 6-aminopenicillanic acid acyl-transferase [Nonomuraea basaltis]|nr:peptidase C45, acyl-coenzyme A - 6-aminopenicillanic acid acyl-transferase [Nonomuraea basaltis]
MTRVAGGKDDFQLVHHLTLTGGQFEIGKALAEEARRLGWSPMPVDPVVSRARRSWFERHWPQHHARMDGAAAALGLDPDQDELALDGLSYIPEGSGCSALWIPPSAATDGHGRVGRNYDFFPATTSEIMGGAARPGELPMASRPYVITTVPDEGLSSTVITMNELDGCMDGINSAGLAVMLLVADFETAAPPESATPQVGLASVQLPRFLVDTCENVDQAKQALLGAKHYDYGIPLHYLVADAHGQAFVWERGRDGSEHIVEFGDGPLCVTNHLLHRNPDPMNLPADSEHSFGTFHRLRTLYERSKGAALSHQDLRDSLTAVEQAEDPAVPFRTLWSTVFDTADRTLSTRFYLGDGRRYSEELVFHSSAR